MAEAVLSRTASSREVTAASAAVGDPRHGPTRRGVLARAVGLGLAGAAVPTPFLAGSSAAAPDPHPAWRAEWETLLAWCDDPGTGRQVDLADCPQWHWLIGLERAIGATPAATLRGATVQLAAALAFHRCYGELGDNGLAALANGVATLEALAGRVRA